MKHDNQNTKNKREQSGENVATRTQVHTITVYLLSASPVSSYVGHFSVFTSLICPICFSSLDLPAFADNVKLHLAEKYVSVSISKRNLPPRYEVLHGMQDFPQVFLNLAALFTRIGSRNHIQCKRYSNTELSGRHCLFCCLLARQATSAL